MADKIFVGRRKNAVARVYLRSGSGKVTINDKELEKYFPLKEHRDNLLLPFVATETLGAYDVFARAAGGGISGQSDSIRLGISRALEDIFRREKIPLICAHVFLCGEESLWSPIKDA